MPAAPPPHPGSPRAPPGIHCPHRAHRLPGFRRASARRRRPLPLVHARKPATTRRGAEPCRPSADCGALAPESRARPPGTRARRRLDGSWDRGAVLLPRLEGMARPTVARALGSPGRHGRRSSISPPGHTLCRGSCASRALGNLEASSRGARRMRRQDLEHIIRAASTVADDDELVIIGSQAILPRAWKRAPPSFPRAGGSA